MLWSSLCCLLMNDLRSTRIFLRGSGIVLCGDTSARHLYFHTVPSVDCKLPEHNWYKAMIVIIVSCVLCRVIQLRLHILSDTFVCTRPSNLLVTHVSVPPGLYLVENISGVVDVCILTP